MNTTDANLLNKAFWDEVIRTAVDIGWERHLSKCKGECWNCPCNHPGGKCSCDGLDLANAGTFSEDHDYEARPHEHGSCYKPAAEEPYLVGGWIQLPTGGYITDDSADFSAIVAGDTVTVLTGELPLKYFLEER